MVLRKEKGGKTRCHGQQLRSKAPRSQVKSRAVDLGRNLEPSREEASGLAAYTIVLIEQYSACPAYKKL